MGDLITQINNEGKKIRKLKPFEFIQNEMKDLAENIDIIVTKKSKESDLLEKNIRLLCETIIKTISFI